MPKDEERIYKEKSVSELSVWCLVLFFFPPLLCPNYYQRYVDVYWLVQILCTLNMSEITLNFRIIAALIPVDFTILVIKLKAK